MSEIRQPDITITIKLHQKQGNKLPEKRKLELFSATQFAHRWKPFVRGKFHPSPPLATDRRQEFWETRYRVRINGAWHGSHRYTLFTMEQVWGMAG